MFSMKMLVPASVIAVASVTGAIAQSTTTTASDNAPKLGQWVVVVDGVMGGLSTGAVADSDLGIARFSGTLSLENNGGFSQIRATARGSDFDGASGVELIVRGDGREYNFNVRCSNARVRAGGFEQSFPTTDGEWTTVRLAFDDFTLTSFGRTVRNAPDLTPSLIESVGVTLSDKKEGPFQVDIASIRPFRGEARPESGSTLNLAALPGEATLAKLSELAEAGAAETKVEVVAASSSVRAMRLAELAVTRGVPLFNDGQSEACSAIYEVTIEAMVALGADELDGSIIRRLNEALAAGKNEHDASRRAWIYRRALDAAYAALDRPSGESRPMASN